MANALATPVVKQWLLSVLTGDATLMALATGGVWADVVGEGAVPPYILVNPISPGVWRYVANSGSSKLLAESVFECKAISHMDQYAALVPIANRIDQDLHQAPPQAITGGTLLSCINDGEIDRTDPPSAGVLWSQVGSRYRIQAQAP